MSNVEIELYQLLKLFNCVETIRILVCKENSSNSFKIEITDKLISYVSCISI